ncbi:hypothetical protein JCM5353_005021 [Sporobolomyces roseus]
MVSPTTLHDLSTASDKRTYLQSILRQIVGSTQRKTALLKAGGVESLLALLCTPLSTSIGEESLAISTEAAAVLAALSLPTLETVSTFASANAYQAIAFAFTRVYETAPSPDVTETAHHKHLDVHLRALKTLFIDLVKLRDAQTFQLHKAIPPQTAMDFANSQKGKEKEKEGDVEMVEVESIVERSVVSGVDYEGALATIYSHTTSSFSSSGPSGSSPTSLSLSTTRQSPTLDALLSLLSEASQSESPGNRLTSFSQRMQIADSICTFLAGTVTKVAERKVIVNGARGKEACVALTRLAETGSDKVREGALKASTAIVRDSFDVLRIFIGEGPLNESIAPFHRLVQSTNPSIRLAAISFCTTAKRVIPFLPTPGASEPSVLLSLIEKEPTLRGQAALTLAHMLLDKEDMQQRAVSANCFDVLKRTLDQLPTLAQLANHTHVANDQDVELRTGVLCTLAALTGESETNRRLLLDSKLLPHLLDSLVHPVAGVRLAACHVLRALSRSVNVLRTDLVEIRAEGPLIQLLREDESVQVQTIAAGIFANLLLDFSPMRKVLIEAGCIPRMCRLALHGSDEGLRRSALSAIKNATYQSSKAFKQSLLCDLTWRDLEAFCDTSTAALLVGEALAIIRNITCVTQNEVLHALDDCGEARLLGILLTHLTRASTHEINAAQALYCLNNIATAGESSQLAIASHTEILRYLIHLLDHPSPQIRTASLWTINNLVYRRIPYSASPAMSTSPRQRRPQEIVEKLRALGLEARLKSLERDPELCVRERVRDIREAIL